MTLTFEERLNRLAETEINMDRIRNIEKCFGNDNKKRLACQGRALVGEGVLIKVCRKKPKPRYFFLFNDILVYGTSVIHKKKYINQHIIPLNNIQIKSISDGDDPKLKNGWLVMSPKKTFCVYATTSKEKIEWMTHISNCVEKLSNINNKRHDSTIEVAPQWIPDKDADYCMRCKKAKFTMVNRRHHCRNCGYVICGDCSKNRFHIPTQSDELLRVCNACYKTLSNSSPENKNEITNTDSSDESDNENVSSQNYNDNNTQFYPK